MINKMVIFVLFREEKERKTRYLKEREVRDAGRDQMRDKYKITKKPREEEEEESEEEDDYSFGGGGQQLVQLSNGMVVPVSLLMQISTSSQASELR